MSQRLTAYLNSEEYNAITEESERLGTPKNFVARLAIRRYFNLPTYIEDEPQLVTPITRDRDA